MPLSLLNGCVARAARSNEAASTSAPPSRPLPWPDPGLAEGKKQSLLLVPAPPNHALRQPGQRSRGGVAAGHVSFPKVLGTVGACRCSDCRETHSGRPWGQAWVAGFPQSLCSQTLSNLGHSCQPCPKRALELSLQESRRHVQGFPPRLSGAQWPEDLSSSSEPQTEMYSWQSQVTEEQLWTSPAGSSVCLGSLHFLDAPVSV